MRISLPLLAIIQLIESGESILQSYKGPELKSGQKYFWQVKIWEIKVTSRNGASRLILKLVCSSFEWKAKWIELEGDTRPYSPATLFRKEFRTSRSISSARIYVTSQEFYELNINGKLRPGSYTRMDFIW